LVKNTYITNSSSPSIVKDTRCRIKINQSFVFFFFLKIFNKNVTVCKTKHIGIESKSSTPNTIVQADIILISKMLYLQNNVQNTKITIERKNNRGMIVE